MRGRTQQHSLVRKLEQFFPLSDLEKDFFDHAGEQAYKVGRRQDLVREGEAPSGMFIILQGFACRYKILPDGARQILAFLLPGDHCDLNGAVFHEMDHSIGTLSPCTVLRIPPEVVLTFPHRQPGVFQALRCAECVQEATLRAWLANIGRRRAEQRVAHLLCELLLRLDIAGQVQDNSFQLPLTQEDIGDTTGLSIVHINRVLQILRRGGLISTQGTTMKILDFDRLKHLANFRPNYLYLNGIDGVARRNGEIAVADLH